MTTRVWMAACSTVVVSLVLALPGAAASDPTDVTYYRLVLAVDTAARSLGGEVTVVLKTGAAVTTLPLDLASPMIIDSVTVGGRPARVSRDGDRVMVAFPQPVQRGNVVAVRIFYHGQPQGKGFSFDAHDGIPMISNYGLPYTAKQWWPSKDTPADKADSADILVTVPAPLVVASNGRLVRQSAGPDGTITFHWAVRYPIYPDVVSVAISDYRQFTYYYRYGSDSLPLTFFVFPQDEAKAREDFSVLPEMMTSHVRVFGPYPFLREKYGVAEFTTQSFREHQTIPSYASQLITGDHKNDATLAHELAHQWFGNSLSLRSWSDVWLNEGFSTYATALWEEHRGGPAAYRARMATLDRPDFAGPVYIADSSNVDAMFTATTFAKGAWVLHMLRRVMGDEPFFRALKLYTSRFAYRNVSTGDFQRVCEEVAGRSLAGFFRQWVYGDSRPKYATDWSSQAGADGWLLQLNIRQLQPGPRPFDMPLDVRIGFAEGDTTVTLPNNQPRQMYRIPVRARPNTVTLDPDGWVLKELATSAEQP